MFTFCHRDLKSNCWFSSDILDNTRNHCTYPTAPNVRGVNAFSGCTPKYISKGVEEEVFLEQSEISKTTKPNEMDAQSNNCCAATSLWLGFPDKVIIVETQAVTFSSCSSNGLTYVNSYYVVVLIIILYVQVDDWNDWLDIRNYTRHCIAMKMKRKAEMYSKSTKMFRGVVIN